VSESLRRLKRYPECVALSFVRSFVRSVVCVGWVVIGGLRVCDDAFKGTGRRLRQQGRCVRSPHFKSNLTIVSIVSTNATNAVVSNLSCHTTIRSAATAVAGQYSLWGALHSANVVAALVLPSSQVHDILSFVCFVSFTIRSIF
jgi:hypothetical protein